MIILIPAYEPGWKLVDLVVGLMEESSAEVIVVNDGSGLEYTAIFDEVRMLGATVLEYPDNRGKGHALKHGFAFIAENCHGEDIVCADSDGQHTPAAIAAVAGEVADAPGTIVLGARGFDGDVPLRSRFGNTATRVAMRLVSGIRLQDTQTGLRGYPADMLEWLRTVEGDRFEYELNVLLEAKQHDIPVREVPIATIYFNGNESSHFRPLADSIRVYMPLLRFAASSMGAAVVDFAMLLALVGLGLGLLPAVMLARLTSAVVNYTVNRRLVFDPSGRTRLGPTAAGYILVAGAVLVANYGVLYLLYRRLGINLALAKVVTETVLFAASYYAQRTFVFRAPKASPQVVAANQR